MTQGTAQERLESSATPQARTGSAVSGATGTEVLTWGYNRDGALGWGFADVGGYDTPKAAKMPSGLNRKVVGGYQYSVALTATGEVHAWGNNQAGQLGTGDTNNLSTPELVYQDPTTRKTVLKGTDVAAGYFTTFALDPDGQTVWAFGSNTYGMLGQGRDAPLPHGSDPGDHSTVPVRVDFSKLDPPLPADYKIVAIAAYGYHCLALTDKGRVLAWGGGGKGQLGNGTTNDNPYPGYVDFSKLDPPLPKGATFTAIAAGEEYSLALTSNGSILGWGANDTGQLGNGSTGGDNTWPGYVDFSKLDPPLPQSVKVVAISGADHSMALTSDGKVLNWGYNYWGELGNGNPLDGGTPNQIPYPVYPDFSKLDPPLPKDTTFKAINAGDVVSFAVTSDGQVIGWGFDDAGKLGLGGGPSPIGQPLWLAIDPGTTVASIGSGLRHTLAVATPKSEPPTKRVEFSWGHGDKGQLGNGYADDEHDRSAPASMALGGALADLSFINTAAGWYHSLAVTTDGDVYACGYNDAGQLGNNDPSFSDNPSLNPVHDLDIEVAQIAGGEHHSLALSKDGTAARAWGGNGPGQLGHGDNQRHPTPVNVLLPAGTYIAIAAGQYHSLALSQDGTVYTWGNNYYGNLGIGSHGPGTNSNKPVRVHGELEGKKVIAIAGGAQHSVAATDDGEVYAWGFNVFGQLGNSHHGKGTDSDVPVKVQGLPANAIFTAVAAGQGHSLACTKDGQVWAWGDGTYGQLGNNSHGRDASSDTAVPVQGLTGVAVTGIAGGGNFSLALNTTTGQAYGWGRDKDGQLGIGQSSPLQATAQLVEQDGAKFAVIAAGKCHGLAC